MCRTGAHAIGDGRRRVRSRMVAHRENYASVSVTNSWAWNKPYKVRHHPSESDASEENMNTHGTFASNSADRGAFTSAN